MASILHDINLIPKIPTLQEIIENAGAMLQKRPSHKRSSTTEYNGNVVNEAELEVHKFLYYKLKYQYPKAILAGGEDISGRYPEFHGTNQLFIVIAACDGRSNYENNSNDYAVTIGFLSGDKPFFGMSYLPAWQTIIMGGAGLPTTINNKPIGDLKSYKSDNVRVGYGLGNRRPLGVHDRLQTEIADLTDEHFRLGCLSVSLLRWLKGEFDLYVSLKEEWNKTCAWYAILAGIPLDDQDQQTWTINIDPARLNLDKAFSLSVATRAIADTYRNDDDGLLALLLWKSPNVDDLNYHPRERQIAPGTAIFV